MKIQIPELNVVYKTTKPFVIQISYLGFRYPYQLIREAYPNYPWDDRLSQYQNRRNFQQANLGPYQITIAPNSKFHISNMSFSSKTNIICLRFLKKYGNPWSFTDRFSREKIKELEFELA